MESLAIRSVVVAGGGIVGWSAAAALKRRLPILSVSVIAIPPEAVAHAGLGAVGYGLHIDPHRYREMMRAFALHLGVTEIAGPISDVRLGGDDGSIEAIQAGGGDIVADLYVDATGPAALLRS